MTDTPLPPKRGVPAWVQVLVFVLLLGLLTVVAFGLKRAQQGTVQVGETIDNFTLQLFSGYEYEGRTSIDLDEFQGKIVVINFWASWCKPCEQEAAELEQAWQYYQPGGEVIFLGVDYVDTEPEARTYLKKFGITFPNGPDMGTRISQQFRIQGVPETYFVDRQGVLRYIQVGPFVSLTQILSIIDGLLAR